MIISVQYIRLHIKQNINGKHLPITSTLASNTRPGDSSASQVAGWDPTLLRGAGVAVSSVSCSDVTTTAAACLDCMYIHWCCPRIQSRHGVVSGANTDLFLGNPTLPDVTVEAMSAAPPAQHIMACISDARYISLYAMFPLPQVLCILSLP